MQYQFVSTNKQVSEYYEKTCTHRNGRTVVASTRMELLLFYGSYKQELNFT